MLNLETDTLLFPGIFSNKVKMFGVFFPAYRLNSCWRVQQENPKSKRRPWELKRLGGLGLKSFQAIIGDAFPSLAWEHCHAIFFVGLFSQKLLQNRLLASVGQGLPNSIFVAKNTHRGICSSRSGFGCSVIRSIYSCSIQSKLPWAWWPQHCKSHLWA